MQALLTIILARTRRLQAMMPHRGNSAVQVGAGACHIWNLVGAIWLHETCLVDSLRSVPLCGGVLVKSFSVGRRSAMVEGCVGAAQGAASHAQRRT